MGHISDDKSTYCIFSMHDSGTEQAKLLLLPMALRDSVDNVYHMFRISSKILHLLFSSLLTELNSHINLISWPYLSSVCAHLCTHLEVSASMETVLE